MRTGSAAGHRGDLVIVCVYLLAGLVVMARYLPDPAGHVSGRLAIDNTWFEWLPAHGAFCVRHLSNPLLAAATHWALSRHGEGRNGVIDITGCRGSEHPRRGTPCRVRG